MLRRMVGPARRLAALMALACLLFAPAWAEEAASLPSAQLPPAVTAAPVEGLPEDERFDLDAPDETNDLDITLSVKPEQLVTPGDVAITFTITNQSGYDVQNVTISTEDPLSAPRDNQFTEPIGRIRVGETQTVVRSHTVTQEELDAGGIDYYISYDSMRPGSVTLAYAMPVSIRRTDAAPAVDFTRQLSSAYVAAGSTVTITYRLRNTGNVPLNSLRLVDPLGSFAARLDELEVGESRTFISRVTLSDAAVSRPSLEYVAASGPSGRISLDPAAINLATGELKARFSVSRSVFNADTADATLTLTNTGIAPCSGIVVTDDVYGGIIADGLTVPAGAPVKVSFTYPMRGEHSEYRWKVSGTNAAGEAVSLTTDTVTLAQPSGTQSIVASLSAAVRTPTISRPGSVTFDLTVSNSGTAMGQDARLYEVNRGEIRRLAVLPAGDPTVCTVSYDVKDDAQFIFCLDYTDAEGRKRSVSTAPIDVRIDPDGALPEAADAGLLPGGESMKLGSTRTFTVLLIIAACALLAMIIILSMASVYARRDRRRRIAAERQRLKEEMGKTNPFTPIQAEKLRKRKRG